MASKELSNFGDRNSVQQILKRESESLGSGNPFCVLPYVTDGMRSGNVQVRSGSTGIESSFKV